MTFLYYLTGASLIYCVLIGCITSCTNVKPVIYADFELGDILSEGEE